MPPFSSNSPNAVEYSVYIDGDDDGDDGWVITNDTDDIAAGWFLPDLAGYDPSRLAAGVFFPSPSRRAAFASFHADSNPNLSVIPPSAVVISASPAGGLVLCRGPWCSYSVCDPANGARFSVPKPAGPHRRDAPLALVPSGEAFHVVAHVEGDAFEVYSTAAGVWRPAPSGVPIPGRLVPYGVTCGGAAYWRTAAPEKPAVVGFDVSAGAAMVLSAPPQCHAAAAAAGGRWQLGEACGVLCCVCVTESEVAVYALASSDADRWTPCGYLGVEVGDGEWDGGLPIVCREPPRPIMFTGGALEVLLWVDGRVVAFDVEKRRPRVAVQSDWLTEDRIADCVPYIDTTLKF